MAHVRAQIRAAVIAVLTGLETTGARVFSGRTRALGAEHEPTLLVYCTDETSDTDTIGPRSKLLRTLQVNVEGRAVGSDSGDLEDLLDQIAVEVEPVMVADPTLNGLSKEVTLIASRINLQSPGENYAGEIRMEYRVTYRTVESEPQIAV
jgi:hypothetical protein